VRLGAIGAEDVDAPAGVEPLRWLLLTTCPVACFADATEKLDWYSRRFAIAVYHRTLTSGCKSEERQLGHAERLEACWALDLVVAWRIFHLAKLGREVPDVPCTVFFEEAEWKALTTHLTRQPIPPAQPPTLREALRMVACLPTGRPPWADFSDARVTASPERKRSGSGCNTSTTSPRCGPSWQRTLRRISCHPPCPEHPLMGNDQLPLGERAG
jgi:hypothetical protein